MIYLISSNERYHRSGVFNRSTLDEMFEWVCKLPEIEIDTETEGSFNHKNKILTLQIGNKDRQYVIDFEDLTPTEIQEISDKILNNPNIIKLLQNAKFDIKFLWRHGMDICNVYDTMLAEAILSAGRDTPPGWYSLYGLVKRYCGVELDKSIRGEIGRLGITDDVISYAAHDVKYLGEIKRQQLEKLYKYKLANKDDITDKYTILGLENRVVVVFAHVEYNGMLLDKNSWEEIYIQIRDLVLEDENELNKMVLEDEVFKKYHTVYQDLFTPAYDTTTIKWSSPQQKLELLKLLIPDIESTDQRTLDKYKYKYPLINKMIQYSKHNKLLTAFAKKLPEHVNPHTGRIHTSFWQILNTGRVSCSRPNLQQIPSKGAIGKKMREAFVAKAGKKIVGGDYSGKLIKLVSERLQRIVLSNSISFCKT